MKKTKLIMLLLLGVFVFTCFCACSKDNDDDISSGKTEGKHAGHEYVDLGLPSGLKWATCNVGASQPGDFGEYFLWGTIDPITPESDYPKVSNGDIIGTDRDVAHVKWGGNWRLPRTTELKELVMNCTWYWTTNTLTGKHGYYVKGPNGNSIFLPAAGNCSYSTECGWGSNKYGYYWSGDYLGVVKISSSSHYTSSMYSNEACSVRPVCP